MFFTLKLLLRTLVVPPAGPLLLAGFGIWLLLRRRSARAARTAGWALLLTALAALWLLATPLVADGLMRLAERCPALDLARPVRAQAIVILSGGDARTNAPEYGGPAVGFELLERVSYGAYLARHTGLPVLVSGGAGDALAMRTVLWRDFGITTRWVEGESRDTFDNAQFSARLLRVDGVRRILLVTSSNHEWRAVQEFARAGLEVEPAPVHVWTPRSLGFRYYLPDQFALLESSEAVYEILGNVVRQLLAVSHLRRQGP